MSTKTLPPLPALGNLIPEEMQRDIHKMMQDYARTAVAAATDQPSAGQVGERIEIGNAMADLLHKLMRGYANRVPGDLINAGAALHRQWYAAPTAPQAATTASASDGSIYEQVSRRADPESHAEAIAQIDEVLGEAATASASWESISAQVDWENGLTQLLENYKHATDYGITSRESVQERVIAYVLAGRAALARAPQPYPLDEYQPGQWWLKSLEALSDHGTVDDDTRRAAKVACNFAAAVFLRAAQPKPIPLPSATTVPLPEPHMRLSHFEGGDDYPVFSRDHMHRFAIAYARAALKPTVELAHGHRDDYHLLANARRVGLMPIHQVVRMPNWVLAHELFATGSASARQICIDAGIDPDGYTVERKAPEGGAA